MSDVVEKMAAHWAQADLPDKVTAVLERAGKDETNTAIEELAGLDQWHLEGLVSTRRLAEIAGIGPDDAVLDAGCGMGGPARFIAQTYGCVVDGIDMTPPYLATGEIFNRITGLSDRVRLQRGDVTAIPFPDGTFDVVWTQHAAQSVPDKHRFFAELFRVAKPGARCVIHDLYRDVGDPVHFPAFWGDDDSISFLVSDAEMRVLLEEVGFEVTYWDDRTDASRQAIESMNEDNAKADMQQQNTIEGLDTFLVYGPERTMTMIENSVADLQARSVGFFEAVLRRPA